MPLAYQIFSSPIGEILVAGSGFAVSRILKGYDRHQLRAAFLQEHADASPIDTSGYIREACSAIVAYLEGRAVTLDVVIQANGTDFQRTVWRQLRQIPYGKTMSYSAIAAAVGAPDAFRAVANACGANPAPLVIPCHRAVHKSGDTVGFGWGAEAKRFLLGLERSHAALQEAENA